MNKEALKDIRSRRIAGRVKEPGEATISIGYERKPELETVAHIPSGFYGKLALSFENGKVVMINKSENIKPGVK